MKAIGDIEVVNLGTGETKRRVVGDGELRLESSPTRCIECGRQTIGVWRVPVTCEDCEQKRRNALVDYESFLKALWLEFADQRERDTVWRRDRSGTPGNMAPDEFFFRQGFKKGIEHALSKRA